MKGFDHALWFDEIARRSSCPREEVEGLWPHLVSWLYRALSQRSSVSIGGAWLLTPFLEREFVACLPQDSEWLMPPRMWLEIRPIRPGDPREGMELFSVERYALLEGLSRTKIQRIFQTTVLYLQEHEADGGKILLPMMLYLSPLEGVETANPYREVQLSDALLEAINKPFAVFSPIRLEEAGAEADLERRNMTSLDDWGDRQSKIFYEVEQPTEDEEDILSEIRQEETPLEPPVEAEPQAKAAYWKKLLLPSLMVLLLFLGLRLLWGFIGKHTIESSPEAAKAQAAVAVTAESQPKEQPKEPAPLAIRRIGVGDWLTRYAAEYYGNKVFWVYIYQENKDKITDPNNVPLGTELVIPSKEKYQIDANDTISLKRALVLQNEIYAKSKRAK